MPDLEAPLRLFNIDDPAHSEMLAGDINAAAKVAPDEFVRGDARLQRFGLVTPLPGLESGIRKFQYVDPSGALIEAAIGAVDREPTAGTWAATCGGDGTGLTALPFDVTDAALQTALNTNPAVTATCNVTVVKLDASTWQVTWEAVGAQETLAFDATDLFPACTITPSIIQTGDATHAQVLIIRIIQRPYAYTGGIPQVVAAVADQAARYALTGLAVGTYVKQVSPLSRWKVIDAAHLGDAAGWTEETPAWTLGATTPSATVTSLQTGTSALPSIQQIALGAETYGGNWTLKFARAQVTRVVCRPNLLGSREVTTVQCRGDGAIKEISRIGCVADVAHSLDGKYFDLDSADYGTLRLFLRPLEPSTTSLTIGTGSKAFTVRAGLGYLGEIPSTHAVRAYSAADSNNYMEGTVVSYSGTTLTVSVTTTSGSGTFADWRIHTANSEPAVPTSGGLWAVTFPPGAAAATIAAAIADRLNGYIAQHDASATAAIVTATDLAYGARTAISAGTSPFSVSTLREGIGSTLHDQVAAVIQDRNGPVQILLSDGGDIASPLPAGGRRLTVTIASGHTAATVAEALRAAVDADAEFSATRSITLVEITDAAYGTRTQAAAAPSGFSVARRTLGRYGLLHDHYFVLFDDTNSAVGIYLTETGEPPGVDHEVYLLSRFLSVTIGATDTGTVIASAVSAVIHADADFSSAATASVLTVTNALSGSRDPAHGGTARFGVSIVTRGIAVTASLAWDAAASDVEDRLDGEFTVSKPADLVWQIIARQEGAQSAFTVDPSSLRIPFIFSGTLNLATSQMLTAFAATGTDAPLSALLEWQITSLGARPWTFYRAVCTIHKDLIDFTTLAPDADGPPSRVSAADVARWDAKAEKTVAAKYRIKSDGSLQLWNPTQTQWHTLALSGAAGAEVLTIAAGES